MLRKRPTSRLTQQFIRGSKIVIAAELCGIFASYLGWRYLNNNQDLRFHLYQNHNWILESYYKVGETISSSSSVRKYDLDTWHAEGKLKS